MTDPTKLQRQLNNVTVLWPGDIKAEIEQYLELDEPALSWRDEGTVLKADQFGIPCDVPRYRVCYRDHRGWPAYRSVWIAWPHQRPYVGTWGFC